MLYAGRRPQNSANNTLDQNLGKLEPGSLMPPGIWTLADVLQYGRDNGTCPYFTVRRMVSHDTHWPFMHDMITTQNRRCPLLIL